MANKLSNEWKMKISKSLKGRFFSKEHRRKIGLAHKGKIVSEKTRAKIREARKKQVFTPETRLKISNATKGENNPFFGKHHSEESLKKMSKAHKGTKVSVETKKKMSLIRIDKKFSKEHRINLSNSHKELVRKGIHPSWKGGITLLNRKIRESIEYKLWRESVFIRDRFTCIFCGEKGGKLNADHIKRFSDYPELRFSIDNGRTLCKECHRKTDTYGNKN